MNTEKNSQKVKLLFGWILNHVNFDLRKQIRFFMRWCLEIHEHKQTNTQTWTFKGVLFNRWWCNDFLSISQASSVLNLGASPCLIISVHNTSVSKLASISNWWWGRFGKCRPIIQKHYFSCLCMEKVNHQMQF